MMRRNTQDNRDEQQSRPAADSSSVRRQRGAATIGHGSGVTTFLALLLLSVLALAACAPAVRNADTGMMDDAGSAMIDDAAGGGMMDDSTADAMMDDTAAGAMIGDDAMMISYEGTILAGTTSPYLTFTEQDYNAAIADGKTVLLNFYANWCPTCKAEEHDAFAAFDALDDPKAIGFRVNYKDGDTDAAEEALAKAFGITYQHTKVVLKDGALVIKSPETWDAARYVKELV